MITFYLKQFPFCLVVRCILCLDNIVLGILDRNGVCNTLKHQGQCNNQHRVHFKKFLKIESIITEGKHIITNKHIYQNQIDEIPNQISVFIEFNLPSLTLNNI